MPARVLKLLTLFLVGGLGGYLLGKVDVRNTENAATSALSSEAKTGSPRHAQVPIDSSPAPSSAGQFELVVSFDWSQLESEDFKVYIDNLRKIGCPEKTIHDIIRAEVDQLYAAHHEALEESRPRNDRYWEARRGRDILVEHDMHLKHRELDREREALLDDLLGDPDDPPDSALADTRSNHAQPTNPAQWSGELRDQVHEIQERFEIMRHQIHDQAEGRFYPDDAQSLADLESRRQEALKQVLSPEQFREFELRESPISHHLREHLSAFEPSEDEFKALFDIHQSHDPHLRNPDFEFADESYREQREQTEHAMNEEIKSVLGEERFAQYEIAQDHRYRDLHHLGQRFELPEENIRYMYDLWRTSEEQVELVHRDDLMDEAQRRQVLEQMRAELDSEARQILGQEVFFNYSNTTGDWMRDLFRD